MTFPTDWDVEKYHVAHESDEHWELRQQFLETHKDKFPEDRLVCLAQVFYNVEFMGCRYPEETMRLVAKLSKGVADAHREKKKSKLQRTFVQASDAASMKVKGQKNTMAAAQPKIQHIGFLKSSESPPATESQQTTQEAQDESVSSSNVPGRYVLADQSVFQEDSTSKKKKRKKKRKNTAAPEANIPNKIPNQSAKLSGPQFNKLVLIRNTETQDSMSVLRNSLMTIGKHIKEQFKPLPNGFEVTFYVDDKPLETAFGDTVKNATNKCATKVLNDLQKRHFTLITKGNKVGTAINKNEVAPHSSSPQNQPSEDKEDQDESESKNTLLEDNKVARMMKMMGWGGGGLGKEEQGRKEPVEAAVVVKRSGLGFASTGFQNGKSANVSSEVRSMLLKYSKSTATHDLVFASDFSKEERKTIHTMARKLFLKSASYGKEPNRQIVVGRKRHRLEIVQDVAAAGGETDKYIIIQPTGNN